jgi:hypothetical protein
MTCITATQNVLWLSGWGVAPDSLREVAEKYFPESDHCFSWPSTEALRTAGDFDLLIAWSLGAWCVLESAAQGFVFPGRAWLLAPFLAFPSEFNLGGRCSISQIRWLKRWLQRDPRAALEDFYKRAGLEVEVPYETGALLEGLDQLSKDASPELRTFASTGLPPNWRAVIGECDPLLNAATIAQLIPGCQMIPGARHRPFELIAALQSSHAI